MMFCKNMDMRIVITTALWLMVSMINGASTQFSALNESYYQTLMTQDDIDTINAHITYIGKDFINNSAMSKLDLSNNYITDIADNAFRKLPNLTLLILNNNKFDSATKLFNFGSHENLQILSLDNSVVNYHEPDPIFISHYPKLEFLSLRENYISNIEFAKNFSVPVSYYNQSKALQYYPEESPFPNLKFLGLSYNRIENTIFLKLLPNSLLTLDLRNNDIKCLKFGRTLENLETLNLDNNALHRIIISESISCKSKYLQLSGLKNLRHLSLFKNEIEIIHSVAFRDNSKLSHLNLSANNLYDLRSDIFAQVNFLEVLDLSFNNLVKIPYFSSHMDNLRFLSLSHNNIKMINFSFTNKKLRQLLLNQNQINEIEGETFAQLSLLEKLDLSCNELSFLPTGWSTSLTSLKYLDLNNNRFTSLHSLSLTNTLPLIEMYLAMNPLEYINAEDLKIMPQNVTISLVQNSTLTCN